MRYKALPPTFRSPSPPPPSPPRPARENLAFLAILVLITLVFGNVIAVVAGLPVIKLAPAWQVPGGGVVVSGSSFPGNVRGTLHLDGSTTGMPSFKTDRAGRFSVTFTVPGSVAPGEHLVAAIATARQGKARAASTTAASAALMVGAAGSAPPSAAPSGSPAPGGSPPPSALPSGSAAAPSGGPSPSTPGGSASPPPTSAPPPGWQPSLPLRAAFYYPWFPEAWDQGGIDPYTNFHPTLGRYDGAAATVIANHVAAMRWAGLTAGIASWWGQGTRTDAKIPALLGAVRDLPFRWALYHEGEGQGDPSVAAITSDLAYIRDHYASEPGFLRVDGRFVVFVYAGPNDGCGMVDRWRAANTVGAYIVLKVFPGYKTCAGQPDGWHQYAPAVAHDSQAGYSYAVSPGFWKVGETPRLVRDLGRFETDVRAMKASNAPFQLVTTFNEWGEGTAVESATEWASGSGRGGYLDVLHEVYLGGLAAPPPAPSATPTPGPTAPPPPGPTATPAPTAGPVTATLVGAGDIASCSSSGDEATAALLASIGGTIFTAGDNAYDSGSPAEYANCFDPSWGQYKSRIRPTPGNHEYGTSGAAGYFGYFGTAAGSPGSGYYAYDLGGWRIYALNSNCSSIGGCGAGSAQEQWLRADLAAHPTACVGAIWHHPLFSSGEHGGTSAVRPLWQALEDAGAEWVVSGHDHDYERFGAQSAAGQVSPRGLVEYVVGTGGRSHYAIAATQPNSVVHNDSTFGVLKVSLRTNGWSWQFVPVAGATFTDSGSGVCH